MMKMFSLIVLVILSSGAPTSPVSAAQTSEPTLSFDRKGHLVQVISADGRRCTYHYAPDGRLISPRDPACGDPQAWLNSKRN